MELGQVCLHRGEELDLAGGCPWIYDNEIYWCDDLCRDGDVVEVCIEGIGTLRNVVKDEIL